MKNYNKPIITIISIDFKNNLANSLSNNYNPNFIEDTDVVMDFKEFM